jgi:hypothetical protein
MPVCRQRIRMPHGSGHPDLSQRPRREAPGMLTGLAILERELGITDYEMHRIRRKLAGRLPKAEADKLRAELAALERRRERTLQLLDEANEEYEERMLKAVAAMRARAMESPRRRKESPDQARRRLGLPPR